MIMLISKKSLFTGTINSMDLPVTQEEIDDWISGQLIQDVFPYLSREQREFLMTGTTPEEWNEVFAGCEE